MTRYLMEDAIKGHQWQSELISGGDAYTYAPSELVRARQRSSELIRAHQSSSELIRAHQIVGRGRQRSSERRYIHVLLAMRRFVHAHMGGDMLKCLFESFNACGRQALLFTLHPSARVVALVVA